MKITSLTHLAFLTCALAVAGLGRAIADDTTPPSDGGKHWHHDSVLTADEHAQLKADFEKAFAADPSLKTEHDALKDQWKSAKDGSADDKQALHEKMHAFHDKLDAAVEKIDPSATALIDKEKAAHHHHDDAPAPSNT